MALSNRERIARGLELLRAGLAPFAEREFKARLGGYWADDLAAKLEIKKAKNGGLQWDTQSLLRAAGDTWQQVFRHVLGPVERAYVGELREIRNRWAHEEPFSNDDTERALDTMKRLLDAISAGEEAEEVGKLRIDLQRVVFAEQARNKVRYQLTLEGMPKAGLKSWRDVVTPHPDVASGRYMQAEFAADLAQVHRGEGSDEYRDPAEFYRRTYITSGLRELLAGALLRLSGKGGDPVVELQTNFGGGKTHSMLALYHLLGESPAGALPGIDDLLKEAGLTTPPRTRRAVLVGTDLSPAQVHRKADGTQVRTLWGDIAWQLGGKEGYALVADSDKRGVSPGAGLFGDLFKRFSPCLILIDEWVAYARQVVGKRDLPAGDFEAQATFAQSLTEAARAADRVLVVASVPASKIEIGGENGELALESLKNVFERVGKAWRPASGDEGFEIVRRRLFEPIVDRDDFAHRDAVVTAFARMYRESPNDFPPGCSEESYRRELETAYPIHPELFRRLYDDWSTLDKFQRTRGVLRLLAKVIHRLWESGDPSLMILPSFVPMDDGPTKSELTRYLHDVWEPIISLDVDGENSLPLELDRSTPTLGRLSACRRVARTLYLGTAPGAEAKNPGIDDRRVRLGCVQPGETTAVFGDALRRLADRAKYIHVDANRYWLSTKPNLNRMAEDRAAALLREPELLHADIERRLRIEQDGRRRGDFAGVHACPSSPGDVPDEPEARLVILGPQYGHRKGSEESAARKFAAELLASKGSGPRLERNCVVFLAPDKKELDALLDATAHFIAWKSIYEQREPLNLDPFHQTQARGKTDEFDRTVDLRIQASWIHALVPVQPGATAEVKWDEIKVTGGDTLAKRTGAKLRAEELLLVELASDALTKGDTIGRMGGARLRMELDRYLWADKNHVSFGQLGEWFARFLYLPRVKNRETLVRAVQDGAARCGMDETFVLANGWDEERKRYRGLAVSPASHAVIEKSTLIVKPEAARAQQEADQTVLPLGAAGAQTTPATRHPTPPRGVPAVTPPPSAPAPPTLFVGSVKLDSSRIGRDAGRIAEEVIQHLSTLPGADAEVTLEIRVTVPGGVEEDVVRTVLENAGTLKFRVKGFERE
jgi:predicted AAA+ superfamily ATPase